MRNPVTFEGRSTFTPEIIQSKTTDCLGYIVYIVYRPHDSQTGLVGKGREEGLFSKHPLLTHSSEPASCDTDGTGHG